MTESRHNLERAIAQFTLGKLAYSQLPELACDALQLGLDGRAIRRLASLNKPSYFEIGDLFQRALLEMGIQLSSKRDAALFLAKDVAEEILSGKKEPLTGAYEIWLLCYAADRPKELVIFGGLDQEFDIPQVLEECRILTTR